MTAGAMSSQLFDGITTDLYSFISGDLFPVLAAILSIFLIFAAYTVIMQILDFTGRSDSEKAARSSFANYKAHRGSFDAPIYAKQYRDDLRAYEYGEDNEDGGEDLDQAFEKKEESGSSWNHYS